MGGTFLGLAVWDLASQFHWWRDAILQKQATARYNQRKWNEDFKDNFHMLNHPRDDSEKNTALNAVAALSQSTWASISGLVSMFEYIDENFDKANSQLKGRYISLLRSIYHRADIHNKTALGEKYKRKLENLSDLELAETNLDFLAFRQELNGHEEKFMLKLVDQAIYDWSPSRFERFALSGIDFDTMKRLHGAQSLENTKEHLRGIWQDPNKNQDVQGRAKRLLERAKLSD